MARFLVHRALSLFATLFAISVAIFVMVRLLPGDIIDVLFFGDTTATPEQKEAARAQLGMTGSWFHQYWEWAGGILLHGDFGNSYRSQQPISTILWHGMHITVELILLGILIALVIALPLGAISAVRRDTIQDYTARVTGLLGISIPNFWLATLLLIFTSRVFHWIPPLTYVPFTSDPMQEPQPVHPAGDRDLGLHARDRDADAARDDARGAEPRLRAHRPREGRAAPERARKHALRNALIPVVTVVGYEIGVLIGGAAVVEMIFGAARARLHAPAGDLRPRLPARAGDDPVHRRRLRRRQPAGRHRLRPARPADLGPA